MDLRGIKLEGMDWILLAQDKDWWRAVVNTTMSSIKGKEFLD
jgi:hypothetical protein